MPHQIRIATRQSKLALWQAEHVAMRLRELHEELVVTLVPMTTQGDRVLDRPLAEVGGKGLFVKELELAIAQGRADIAVHSMKDVPSELPPGMRLAAMLERADARDAFVSTRYATLDALPSGARVGTSSPRRHCQLLATRPDLEILPLRGNVDTRLRKLDAGQYEAIVLASAGLKRLGWEQRIASYLDTKLSVPAVGQGIIGIECRHDDENTAQWVRRLDDATSSTCIAAERAFAARLEGSCQSPIAAHAILNGAEIEVHGLVGSPDGKRMYREAIRGSAASAADLGTQLAERLLAAGADRLLAELRMAGP